MKSVKVSISETAELLRLIAEDYLVNDESISNTSRRLTGEYSEAFRLFYNESHLDCDRELVDSSIYGYLGREGVILFLLFLAEYQENP